MKYKLKILILFLVLLLSTGCSVDYNLTIDELNAIEDFSLYVDNNSSNTAMINDMYQRQTESFFNQDTDDSEYYEVKKGLTKDKKSLFLNFRYNYPLKKLQNSNAISECFYNKSVTKDQEYITLNTSKGFDCIYKDTDLQIEDLTINIKTNLKVVETNSDKVKKNTYTWHIDKDNYQEKNIYMKISYTEENREKSGISEYLAIPIVMIVTVLLIFVAFKFRTKNRK